jgi:hypothetical protein
MKTTKFLICAISIVAALAAANAKSQTLSAHLVDVSPGLSVNGTLDNGAFVQDYDSGVLRFTEFDAFCVEPFEGISYGESLVYDIQNPGTLANYDTISRLIGGYLASGQTASDAAAVQWAIWETTSEITSSPSVLDGNVRITTPAGDSIAALANNYLLNANSFAPASLVYLTNNGRQDVVSWNVIPEPASLGLAALSGLLLLRRRR